MLGRLGRGLLVTVIISFVVVSAVGSAASPLAAMLPESICADLGAVRVALKL